MITFLYQLDSKIIEKMNRNRINDIVLSWEKQISYLSIKKPLSDFFPILGKKIPTFFRFLNFRSGNPGTEPRYSQFDRAH